MNQDDQDNAMHQLRMQRLEEAELASKKYRMPQRYMHLSALKPNTRRSHAQRHGKLFTADEVREFWRDPSNRVGCCCAIVPVIVDSHGHPQTPGILDRAAENYKVMAQRGYAWALPDDLG